MNERHPVDERPAPASSESPEERPAAHVDETVFFEINESAYGQFLGLVHWNDSDRWYHGSAPR